MGISLFIDVSFFNVGDKDIVLHLCFVFLFICFYFTKRKIRLSYEKRQFDAFHILHCQNENKSKKKETEKFFLLFLYRNFFHSNLEIIRKLVSYVIIKI